MSETIVKEAAELRGRGSNLEAIDHVMNNQAQLDDITRLPALLQAFYAAEAIGLTVKAKEIARLIEQEDPDLPSIQKYLS